jgi:transcription elongation factor Elf1
LSNNKKIKCDICGELWAVERKYLVDQQDTYVSYTTCSNCNLKATDLFLADLMKGMSVIDLNNKMISIFDKMKGGIK